MIKKHFPFISFIIFLFAFLNVSYSWWSIEIPRSSTHNKLTEKAINQIRNIQNDTAKCPDIERFGDKIIEWTTSPGNDENAHGKKYEAQYGVKAGDYNGGPYELWWEDTTLGDGLIVKYNQRNFSNGEYSSYYYLAMMAHLIADQAVPAHVANIAHGFPALDNLEGNAYWTSPGNGDSAVIKTDTTSVLNLLKRYYYFGTETEKTGLIPTTQNKILFWKSPIFHRNYWSVNDSAIFTGKAFDSAWGHYTDSTNNYIDVYAMLDDNQDIIPTQFSQAIGYMSGFLQSASKSLPPIVSALTLTNRTILSNDSTIIKFTVDENRQPDIWLKMTVDGKAVKDMSGIVYNGAGDSNSSLNENSDTTELPWKASYEIPWNGLLEDSTYPADGPHNLLVQVIDSDGNWSDSAVYDSFYIDFNPPEVSNVKPLDSSYTNNRRPVFSAEITDQGSSVVMSSLKIELDGFEYAVIDHIINKIHYISFIPDFDLTNGVHNWKIKGRDANDHEIEDVTYKFTIDTTPPQSITNLTAQSGDTQITLNWENPTDADYALTEVYRSSVDPKDYNYESSKVNSLLVYTGSGTTFTDISLINGKRYFYSFYAKDVAGNNSDKVMVSAIFDTEPPKILNPFPNNITFRKKTTDFSALFSDTGSGLNLATLKVIIDSTIISVNSQAYDNFSGEMTYDSDNELFGGKHTWSISIRDKAENETTEEYTFRTDTEPPKVRVILIK